MSPRTVLVHNARASFCTMYSFAARIARACEQVGSWTWRMCVLQWSPERKRCLQMRTSLRIAEVEGGCACMGLFTLQIARLPFCNCPPINELQYYYCGRSSCACTWRTRMRADIAKEADHAAEQAQINKNRRKIERQTQLPQSALLAAQLATRSVIKCSDHS